MPRSSGNLNDPAILEAALEGLLLQKKRIESQIQEIRARLGRRRSTAIADQTPATPRRELSTAARKRIAAAQKKRWAEYRRQRPKPKSE